MLIFCKYFLYGIFFEMLFCLFKLIIWFVIVLINLKLYEVKIIEFLNDLSLLLIVVIFFKFKWFVGLLSKRMFVFDNIILFSI